MHTNFQFAQARMGKVAITLLMFTHLLGCSAGMNAGVSFTDLLPVPGPRVDIPIRSVGYYKAQHGVDLLGKEHDMQAEIQSSRASTDLVNRMFHVSVNGTQVKAPYNDRHLANSRKLGPNDYVVAATNVGSIEKQIGTDLCWAASLQYFLQREYSVTVSQQRIVDQMKKGRPQADMSASAMELVTALGFTGLTVSTSGAHQLIEALGRDHVAILGVRNPKDDVGHAVVVVAARYSFVSTLSPLLPAGGGVAFSELTYLDPAEGKLVTAAADEFDERVGFVLTKAMAGK